MEGSKRKKDVKISVLIPCYNEAGRVERVLRPVLNCKVVDQVVVVNDGSTDNTYEVLKKYKFNKKFTLVNLQENIGKGGALKEGLKKVRNDIVFLCDADLYGLKEGHIEKLLQHYLSNKRSIVVGLKEKKGILGFPGIRSLRKKILPLIGGERILSKTLLEKILDHPLSSQYGIEAYMNYFCKLNKIRIVKVDMKKVDDFPKYKKNGYSLSDIFFEFFDVSGRYLRIYTVEVVKDFGKNAIKKIIFTPEEPKEVKKYTTGKIKVDGINIHYAERGKGETLVFVHGWANNWISWIPLGKYLYKKYRVVFIDLPGFGDSDSLKEYSIEKAAYYLRGFIKKLDSKPKAVIGLSMGSLVVSEAGYQDSDLSEKLVIIGAPIKTALKPKITPILKKTLELFKGKETPEFLLKKLVETRMTAYFLAKYINMYEFNKFLIDTYGMIGKKKMRKEAFVQMGISAGEYDLGRKLGGIKMPILLVYGREDKVVNIRKIKESIDKLGKKDLVFKLVPKAGHIVSLEKAKKTAKIIYDFLEKS